MGNLSDLKLDPNAPAESGSYGPIPAGEYIAAIQSSEMRDTKAGTGKYLNLEFEVQGPTHTGRKIFEKLNLVNPSVKAQEIARASLSAICRAINVPNPQDSADLHCKPMLCKVVIEPGRDGYEPQNKIVSYRAATATPGAPSALPARGGKSIGEAMAMIDAAIEASNTANPDDVPF